MDFRDAWLYSDFIHPKMQVPLVRKGVSVEKVKEIVAGWKELANMYRIQKLGYVKAVEELAAQGKINHAEFQKLVSKHGRQAAAKEGFDIDKAQKRFMKKE